MENAAIALTGEDFGRSLRPNRFLLLLCCLLPLSLCVAQEVRKDLPANDSIRIENRRGNVTVEVRDQKDVSVIANYEGETPKQSPVVIRVTKSLLNVLVASGATLSASSIRVDLVIGIPARARAEIITNDGVVEVRGMPASLNAQTLSGDIRVYLPSSSGVDIRAETASGEVTQPFFEGPGRVGSKWIRIKQKGDAPQLRLRSQSGSISLNPLTDLNRIATSESNTSETQTPVAQDTSSRPPTLGENPAGNKAAGTPASPPTGEPQEIDEGDVIRVDTELVTLNVSVVDRATSRGLKGLVQTDFKLFEDGVEQEISHFESSNAPFNLILLIDLSGSTKDKVALIKTAAQHFVDAARLEDNIAIITFAASPVLVSNLTADHRALRERISSIATASGDTKLYDALNFAMTEALKSTSRSRRNAVVVMSDGLDGTLPSVNGDGSALSYSEILSQVREFDGVLYSIWVDTEYESLSDKDTQPEDFDAGHDRMAEIADAGGGLFYEVAKLEDLAGAYERVVADIGTVYSLAYRPANSVRDGKWRAIRVKVARPDAVARGKSGYFAK